jgi:hypothetical protein
MYSVDIYSDSHPEVINIKLPFVPEKEQFISYYVDSEIFEGKITHVTIQTIGKQFLGFDVTVDGDY